MRLTRWSLPLAPLVLGFVLTMGLAPSSATAQEPPPEPGSDASGRPFDGYFATGALAGLVLFIVGKSARRS